MVGRQTALKELRQSSRITGIWSNISDEAIEAADDEVDTGGEFGMPPGGEDDDQPTRDGWNEGDHPRAENGEFSEGGGGSSETGPHGPIFREHSGKPAEAIQRLMKEKKGEVPAAWTHPQLGAIDLVWGNESGGLQHIIEKHVEKQKDLKLEDLVEMIPKMALAGSDGRTAQLLSATHRAAVRLDYDGEKKRWLVSAFERTRG